MAGARGRLAGAMMAAALAFGAALAGGCSVDGAGSLLGTSATGGAGEASAVGAAYTSDSAKPAFNPFSDQPQSLPERVVITNPTLQDVLKPGPLPEFSLGRADAPVVMVKYMSLTCPHCKRFMAETFPQLRREYIDTGKVRLVIREFPIGKTSGNATIALRCASMGQYLPLYQKFLEQQASWVSQEVRPEAILKVAAQAGLTGDQYNACLKDQALIDGLKQVKERGRQLGIIGTPNFFVGNKLVKSVLTMPEIRAIVDPMLAGRGAQAKAG